MTKFIRHFIAICFIIAPLSLFAKSTYSDKKVHLSAGQVSLGTILKNISSQTACVFSYDPVKINEKQIITVPTRLNCSLSGALQKLLPKNIQFRFKNKFIVLQRVSTVLKEVPEKKAVAVCSVKSIVEPLGTEPIAVVDSLKPIAVVTESATIVPPDPIVEAPQVDTVFTVPPTEVAIALNPSPILHNKDLVKKDTHSFGRFIRDRAVLEVELSGYSSQLAGAVHLGLYGFYAILWLGKNADKAQSTGVGIGAAYKVHKYVGLSLDVLRLDLLSGPTYNLGVRTVITQFRPEINFYIVSSCQLFAGPTFNMLNSTYVNTVRTYDLGKVFYYGGIIGVKVDLSELFWRRS